MAEPIAIWGAVTGTIGAGLALRREVLARRTRLAVRPGVSVNMTRDEGPPRITHAWAFVNFWNIGGRPLAAERVGFTYLVTNDQSGKSLSPSAYHEHRLDIHLDGAIELPVDGPSHRVSTPLGPLLKAGMDPHSLIRAFVITTGDKEWVSPPQGLLGNLPPMTTRDQLANALHRLADDAALPAIVGQMAALVREEPYLPAD